MAANALLATRTGFGWRQRPEICADDGAAESLRRLVGGCALRDTSELATGVDRQSIFREAKLSYVGVSRAGRRGIDGGIALRAAIRENAGPSITGIGIDAIVVAFSV